MQKLHRPKRENLHEAITQGVSCPSEKGEKKKSFQKSIIFHLSPRPSDDNNWKLFTKLISGWTRNLKLTSRGRLRHVLRLNLAGWRESKLPWRLGWEEELVVVCSSGVFSRFKDFWGLIRVGMKQRKLLKLSKLNKTFIKSTLLQISLQFLFYLVTHLRFSLKLHFTCHAQISNHFSHNFPFKSAFSWDKTEKARLSFRRKAQAKKALIFASSAEKRSCRSCYWIHNETGKICSLN